MKFKFETCVVTLMLATTALAQTYQNDGIVQVPPQIAPQIDAVTFINNNVFNINFTNVGANLPAGTQLYKTANTLNYTNRGIMEGNTGFIFDNGPSGNGFRKMANNFNNLGIIRAGSVLNSNNYQTNLPPLLPLGLPKIGISATNVSMNSGTNVLGKDGIFSISGKNVDLNRGTIQFEGFESPSIVFNFFTNDTTGIFDSYWATNGSQFFDPVAQFEGPIPTTPVEFVSTPGNGFQTKQLSLPGAITYVGSGQLNATAVVVQVAFVRNTKPGVDLNLYMFFGEMDVEWVSMRTNASGVITTNYLYLTDDLGPYQDFIGIGVPRTPLVLVPDISPYNNETRYIPLNYQFHRAEDTKFNLGTPFPPSSVAGVFFNIAAPVDTTSYGAVFRPVTVEPMALPGQTLSNLPSKVEIVADGILNLSRTRISGANYMNLKAVNHFSGSAGADISSAFNDISLASTNGILNITNLVAQKIRRLEGTVDLWSGRWFNDGILGGVGTRFYYHVLFVDSQLSPTATPQIQDLNLKSVNVAGGSDSVTISDPMKVTRNFKIDTRRLTITTNPVVAGVRGELSLESAAITWSPATPRLQYFTNNGSHVSFNAVFFGGSRSSPYYTSNFNEPYLAMVNRGTITNEGSLIWADYFENSGTVSTGPGFGSVELQSQTTRLTNGAFLAYRGDVLINTHELVVTNHTLLAGRTLSLSATTLLTDGGGTNGQTWSAGNGVNLTAQPNNGDLLNTTIFDNASPGAEVTHVWAGQDRGCSPAGFANNAALGRLVLDGGSGSQWTFSPANGVNALYVDSIEFRDFSTTTIINPGGNVEGVQIDPGMKIYYAQALATDGSVAERINGANGGQFCWVSDYAGLYSSTNFVDEFGNTNKFNAALVQSCNLDSDGDGLVNCIDPSPILTSKALNLQVVMTKAPASGALVSWQSTPQSTNHVFYRDSMLTGSWQPLTNIVNPNPMYGRLSIFDPMAPSKTRYYKVQVDVLKP